MSLGISQTQKQQLQFSALIIGAVALTVGLSWNNAVNGLINKYFPEDQSTSNAWYKVAYAAILTVVVGIIMRFI